MLLALLVPGLRRAMDLRDQVNCLASLHQVGLGVTGHAADHFGTLPDHYGGGDLAFDTFWMRSETAADVNLGLLDPYIDDPNAYYCPTQTAETSPALAYDTPKNKWPENKGKGKGRGKGNGNGNGNGQGNAEPPAPSAGAGLNSSFAVRTRDYPAAQPSWRVHNYANKVIFTDFTGVDAWQGTGRFAGAAIHQPHEGEGYNRLFGNGSAVWIAAPRVQQTRPVTDVAPNAQQMHEYHQLLDVVP